MSVLVPKSVKGKNLDIDEVSAFYAIEPVDSIDEDYDFDKSINKILTKYAENNVEWKSKQSKYDGKAKLKKMIKDENFRMNKNKTRYLNIWTEFEKWRKKQIIYHCNLPDEEKKKMREQLPVDDKDERRVNYLKTQVSRQKKEIQKKDLEIQKYKLILQKMQGVKEYVDPETGEINPNFVYDQIMTEHLTPMDYTLTTTGDDPYKIYIDICKKVSRELFSAFKSRPTSEYRHEITALFGEWVTEEYDNISEEISDEFEKDNDDIDCDFQAMIDDYYNKNKA